MRERHYRYISSVILILCFVCGVQTAASAQQTIPYESGLPGDSVQKVPHADSMAVLPDTVQTELSDIQQKELTKLEAPVDTAALVRQNDSIQQAMLQQQTESKKKRWLPVPNNSIWLGLVIPGAGQIYNHKYWKLPIIYGGFLGCTYALTWNTKMYKDYSQAYQDIMSDNPENDSYMNFIRGSLTKEDVMSNLDYYQNLFRQRKDAFRRQRDLSIFVFIGVYLLSVVDAYVDAELSNFDISDDLTMTLEPTIFNDAYRGRPQGIGIQCNIKF